MKQLSHLKSKYKISVVNKQRILFAYLVANNYNRNLKNVNTYIKYNLKDIMFPFQLVFTSICQ